MDERTAAALDLLERRGAQDIPHPGGTLLEHLRRVHALLERWHARPAVRLAGLCHAFYGTDGFPTALGETGRRAELAACIGEDAENLVYFYASCDRALSHPGLARQGPFRDRFTGELSDPPPRARRDFAEITVANELDIAEVDPEFREKEGPALRDLFLSWDVLLSDPARQAVQSLLP